MKTLEQIAEYISKNLRKNSVANVWVKDSFWGRRIEIDHGSFTNVAGLVFIERTVIDSYVVETLDGIVNMKCEIGNTEDSDIDLSMISDVVNMVTFIDSSKDKPEVIDEPVTPAEKEEASKEAPAVVEEEPVESANDDNQDTNDE